MSRVLPFLSRAPILGALLIPSALRPSRQRSTVRAWPRAGRALSRRFASGAMTEGGARRSMRHATTPRIACVKVAAALSARPSPMSRRVSYAMAVVGARLATVAFPARRNSHVIPVAAMWCTTTPHRRRHRRHRHHRRRPLRRLPHPHLRPHPRRRRSCL